MTNLERIKLIEVQAVETGEYEMNFAMLVAHLRQIRLNQGKDTVIIEVGVWRLKVQLLGDVTEEICHD